MLTFYQIRKSLNKAMVKADITDIPPKKKQKNWRVKNNSHLLGRCNSHIPRRIWSALATCCVFWAPNIHPHPPWLWERIDRSTWGYSRLKLWKYLRFLSVFGTWPAASRGGLWPSQGPGRTVGHPGRRDPPCGCRIWTDQCPRVDRTRWIRPTKRLCWIHSGRASRTRSG